MTDVQDRETIFRLRSLHGVYERALQNAADVIVESQPRSAATERAIFEALLKQAAGQLQDAGVFHGRWSLFSDDELLATRRMFSDAAGMAVDRDGDGMLAEIESELIRRKVSFEFEEV